MKAYVLEFPQGGKLIVTADEIRVRIESTFDQTRILISVEPDIAREIAAAIVEIAAQVKVTN